ncbi:esterase/lipase family protein [Streptomyces rimosus]|uniref:esterase/lipase family protein n=1 Tax=Streptomyces rimosus TaxID=1927 RepID=UPI000997B164|nr:hypothetical protein [Streptomyces rimosus]
MTPKTCRPRRRPIGALAASALAVIAALPASVLLPFGAAHATGASEAASDASGRPPDNRAASTGTAPQAPTKQTGKPAVVFVHGMNDSTGAFDSMVGKFKEAGWSDSDLFAWSYNWKTSNRTNANAFREATEKKFGTSRKIAIVAHSLGSVLTRYAIKTNASFRGRVATWTSLGGPNKHSGQSFWGKQGLNLVCNDDGTATEWGKKNFPNLVSDSTCELDRGGLMRELNTSEDGPTPRATDYEEAVSTSDSVVSNDASLLQGTPNNHHWTVGNVRHENLPRDSGVIDHVVSRVSNGPWKQRDENLDITFTGEKRQCGQSACLDRVYGTASPWAVKVRVTATDDGGDYVREVDVMWGDWSLNTEGLQSMGGDFGVTVEELYGPRRSKSGRV